jgi:hypothetical protein
VGGDEIRDVTRELRARVEACITPLPGWTTPEKGLRLAELIVQTGPDLSVELGVFGGRGTLSMAIGHQAIGKGEVAAVDPWDVAASLDGGNAPENDEWWGKIDHEAIYRGFLDALVRCGLTRQCRVVRQRSDAAVRLFADGTVAVLHQDGNHSEQISTAEVELWAPKLSRGGYWVADDTDWTTTRRAQALLGAKGFVVVEDHDAWRIYRKP